MKDDNLNLIITGVGGQGNVLASQVVGMAALHKGYKVTVGETFGLSQRGGPVMSHIRISGVTNMGPLIPPNMCHMILGLEPLETLRTVPEFANEHTVFIVNARPIYPLNVIAGDAEYPSLDRIRSILSEAGAGLFWIDATRRAMDLGGPILLNMVMLGALSSQPLFPLEKKDIQHALKNMFADRTLDINNKALDAGCMLIENIENNEN